VNLLSIRKTRRRLMAALLREGTTEDVSIWVRETRLSAGPDFDGEALCGGERRVLGLESRRLAALLSIQTGLPGGWFGLSAAAVLAASFLMGPAAMAWGASMLLSDPPLKGAWGGAGLFLSGAGLSFCFFGMGSVLASMARGPRMLDIPLSGLSAHERLELLAEGGG